MILSLMGAWGMAIVAWGLALWVPGAVMALSPRMRIRERLRPLVNRHRPMKHILSYLDQLASAAGTPWGWSGAKWGRVGLCAGTLLGLVVWWQTGFHLNTLVVALLFAVAAPALVVWVLQQEVTTIRRRRQVEMVRLIDGIQVLLSGGSRELFGAINATLPMLDALRPPVERLLARWGQDPIRALDRFYSEVQMEETAMLTAVLQHAVQVGEREAAPFLAQEGLKLEKMREEQVKELIRSRPQVFTLSLVFPLAAVALAFLFPFFHRMVEMIGGL